MTPFFGYRAGGDFDARDNDLYTVDVEADNSMSYGLRANIPVAHRVQIELLASRQPTEFVTERPLFGQPEEPLGDLDITYYQVGVLFQWGNGPVRPFVTPALGIAHLSPEFGSSEDKFSASIGGGVKILTTEHFGVRLEVRGMWANTSNADWWDWDDDWDDCCKNRDLVQFEGVVGLVFAF